jgi:transcriptional regulator with XRE-family HTH domain
MYTTVIMLTLKSQEELLLKLGGKIKRMRLDCNWTREELGKRSGIAYSTLRRLESTGNASMSDYLKVLRALAALDELADLIKPPPVSPYELIRLGGKRRERASATLGSSEAPYDSPHRSMSDW